jgi:hypothetical protein
MIEHRPIDPESFIDLQDKIQELSFKPKKIVIPPKKQYGSWFEEFSLRRIIGFIRDATLVDMQISRENDGLFLYFEVNVLRFNLVRSKIKLL